MKRAPQRGERSPQPRPAKLRLITLDSLDGRTIASRRVKEFVQAISADLGGVENLSEGERQLITRAALLGVVLESVETRWLAGEQVDLADYLSAVDRQRRCLCALGLERRAKDAHLPLRERIAGAAR